MALELSSISVGKRLDYLSCPWVSLLVKWGTQETLPCRITLWVKWDSAYQVLKIMNRYSRLWQVLITIIVITRFPGWWWICDDLHSPATSSPHLRWWKGPTRPQSYQGSNPLAVASPAPIQQDFAKELLTVWVLLPLTCRSRINITLKP